MNDDTKKSRRRRRRPRASAKAKARAKAKAKVKARESKVVPQEEKNAANARRGRSRRRAPKAKARNKTVPSQFMAPQQQEQQVSPIDDGIFIYTYTLRPRTLLDEYEASPKIAERMEFES